MIRIVCLLLLIPVLLAPPAATADDQTELIAKIDGCIGRISSPADHADLCMGVHVDPCTRAEGGDTTQAMVACINTEITAWETVMERELANLRTRLDDEQTGVLHAAQRAWVAFRTADCEFPHVFVRGTLSQPWAADCIMQHTARRALELRSFIDYLEY
ncbi:MAG: lysozyme inhibitor LprI family protein [Pseudomonadota bacterium]